jgi:hypothetical protein
LIELPAVAGPLLNRFSFFAARLPQRGYKPRKDSLQWRRGADSPPMSQRERVAPFADLLRRNMCGGEASNAD